MKIENLLNLKEIGLRIRLEREKHNLSRENLAEIVNLSSFYIGQIERGDRSMSLDTLVKISDTLNISIDYTLKGETIYMENIYSRETIGDIYKDEMNKEIQELLDLLSGLSKEKVFLIKELSKLILPYVDK